VRADLRVRVGESSIDCIDHECDEGFALILGEQAAYKVVGDTGKPEWVYESKSRGDLVSVGVEFIEFGGEVFCERAALDIDFEMGGQLDPADFAIEVINTVLAFFNKEEDQLPRQIGAMRSCRFQGNNWGAGLAAGISAGTGKTIDIDNPAVIFRKNWEPCVEIPAENLVLGRSMRLKIPNCFFRYGHVTIKTNTMALVWKEMMGYVAGSTIEIESRNGN